MSTDLAKYEETSLAMPSKQDAIEQLERASFVAEQLAKIVTDRGWYANIQGKKYLEVEAWQFIGFQANINADIEYTRPILDEGGGVVAYESKAVLTRNGLPFSSGIMECGMDSFPTRGKRGREQDKAAQSASQTWAISKAYRNRLAFIAKMAGYESTPADEVRTVEEAAPELRGSKTQSPRGKQPGLVERAITELGFADAAEVLRALGCEKVWDIIPMYQTTHAAWEALCKAVDAPVSGRVAPNTSQGRQATARPSGASTEASEDGPGEEPPPF